MCQTKIGGYLGAKYPTGDDSDGGKVHIMFNSSCRTEFYSFSRFQR